MCFLLLIVMCMNFALFAVDLQDPDVQIMHLSKRMVFFRFAYFVRVEGVEVECIDGKMRNVCDVLEDQVLAAFCFKPDVPRRYWGCSELCRKDIRSLVCDEGPFFSPEIRACFGKIAQASNVRFGWSPFKKKLIEQDVLQRLYPEGMTRRWTLVSADDARKGISSDEILITFNGKSVMLYGSRPFKATSPDAIRPGSLLGFKRAWSQALAAPERPLFVRGVPVSFEIPKWSLLPKSQSVGLMYFPKGGGQVRALFDLTGVVKGVLCGLGQKALHKEEELFDTLREALWGGYILKRYAKPFDVIDLSNPVVRETLCYRQRFVSHVLRSHLQETFCGFLQENKHVVSEDYWSGCTVEHLAEVCGECGTLQWELMDNDVFLHQLDFPDVEKRFEEKIFILLQGESVVAQGTPFDSAYEDDIAPPLSLAYYSVHERVSDVAKKDKKSRV